MSPTVVQPFDPSPHGDSLRDTFVAAILSYIAHGLRRDTENQFAHPDGALKAAMLALMVAEIGGFGVLLAGFVVGQFF